MGPSGHSEPDLDYLQRSGRPAAAAIREFIEVWLARYPKRHLSDLLRRLQTPEKFDSAFFELYLYEMLTRKGFPTRVHPRLSGRLRRPDFKSIWSSQPVYVEAVTVYEGGRARQWERTQLSTVYDILNTMKVDDYFFEVTPQGAPRTMLSAKKLVSHVQRFLDALNYQDVCHIAKQGDFNNLPRTVFAHDGLVLSIRALPVAEHARGSLDLIPAGMIGPTAVWSDSGERLHTAIKSKATRYGKVRIPYIVAVNLMGHDPDSFGLFNALLGTFEQVIYTDARGAIVRTEPRRRPDGIWLSKKGPSYRRLSAVIVFTRLTPWTIASSQPVLIHNPWARRPVIEFMPEIGNHIPGDGEFIYKSATASTIQIMGLDPQLADRINNSI